MYYGILDWIWNQKKDISEKIWKIYFEIKLEFNSTELICRLITSIMSTLLSWVWSLDYGF